MCGYIVLFLMTNYVHLLLQASDYEGISYVMQSLGRYYVRYINTTYNRTGTLWEGRFKSSLVNSDEYLLQVYQYIELNPVRAKMVDTPKRTTYGVAIMQTEAIKILPC